jgi:hypothetical protein
VAIFQSHAARSQVEGLVLGISMYDVTPPRSAARLSVPMQPLWVRPGSLK